MRYQDLFATASESLFRTKSRSLLTILGIVIGIAAVILMLSIGQGAERFILSEVADLGADLVFVEPASGDPTSGPPSPFIEQTMTLQDADEMSRSGLFTVVSPTLVSTVPVTFGEVNDFLQIQGVDSSFIDLFPGELRYGSYLEESDIDSYAKVAVIGSEVAEDFFGDRNPVGERIKIKSNSYRVIGVFEEQGTRFFQNLDKQVSIPVTTMQRDVLAVEYVNYITARVPSGAEIENVKEDLRYLMRDVHDIDNPEGDPALDDFFVSSQDDATETIGMVGNVLTILLSSIAAISLVVGGIGIMNIMLVSVTERTREIGLRKAVGATYKEILQQFLVESVLLTLFGGLIGVLVGSLVSYAVGWVLVQFFLPTWTIVIPLNAVFLGAAVSTVVGLVFGIYPARSAARLNPIDALRYE
ncbi:multidrug ABC transporter substrate-binding protein [Candidatus Uhrbacteria bacterium CG10_big_fil_rev_8_21_14_0_10_48_16]|uniref:Multidrug ABC transporter substrate-binding protein n=1 Tax=Candidatus Uhrbacteria bacterium CG10_big_fil_rev_8_21_14_0_10_48_16 TaxID=1975038 RepID=A0A2M8LI49_9BACT|nr:MAG: multidrug ABC transporter substrate-binding protein [Candidatus Uhrbacteria bacterium CG10_big_fil_rev_8_21_14_0_10_48_16]